MVKKGTLIGIIAISLCIILICGLIFGLDYYPYTQLEIKNGYCTNMKTKLWLTNEWDGAYFYTTDIYNEINGTFIGEGNGGTGQESNSYVISAGIFSRVTDNYPYESYKGNIPSWLSSYITGASPFWDILRGYNTKEKVDEVLWPDTWVECEYSSLEFIKQMPWNTKTVAQSGDYKYMTNIKIYDSSFKNIKNTDHFCATVGFLLIFIMMLLISSITLLRIECHNYITSKEITNNNNNDREYSNI